MNHLFQFKLEKDDCVLKEGAKDKDDAGDHPTLYSCQTFSLPIDDDNVVVTVVVVVVVDEQFCKPKNFSD